MRLFHICRTIHSCGTKITEQPFTTQKRIETNPWDYDEQLNPIGDILEIGDEIMIPNMGNYGQQMNFDYGDRISKPVDIPQVSEAFRKFNADNLKKIEELYQAVPVIEYGTIVYAH